jgi:antitoxin (DNA-binding transcriptional repressor) of toxin-antitoxin stability system
MSRATVEEFQKNAAVLLAAVERGEQFVIARGQKAVARLLPAEDDWVPDAEREEWTRAAMANLARAYGPDEPDYSAAAIIEPNPHYRPCEREPLFSCRSGRRMGKSNRVRQWRCANCRTSGIGWCAV